MAVLFLVDDPEPPRSLRALPHLVRLALGLLWAAGRRELARVLVLEALGAAGLAAVVLLSRGVVDRLLAAGAGTDRLGAAAGPLFAVLALVALLAFGGTVAREQRLLLGELVSHHATARILDVTGRAPLAAFDRPAFHDRLSRAQHGALQAQQVVFGVLGLVGGLGSVAGVVVALVALEPLLLPLAVLALVPAALASSRRGEALYRFAYRTTARDRERHYLGGLLMNRADAAEVRALDLGDHLRERHDALAAERVRGLRGIVAKQLRWALTADVATALIVAATLAGLLALADDGRLDVAGATAAAGAILLFGQRASQVGSATGTLYESALFLEDLDAFLAAPASPPIAPIPDAALEARDVRFRYPGAERDALDGVSVRVEPGEIVALVGANGSGKTTLARLLAGLYAPDAGEVRGPGRDAIAVAFQDFAHFMLTARENIAFGRHERSGDDAGVRAAAQRAGADADIDALPDGEATMLGPAFAGGTDLSGGQWQRLALARTFFRDAACVILDEPTAALDAHAEHALFARLHAELQGRSALLISHRFSSVREADRIYVLEAGRVTEHGTHAELVARGGTYAGMFAAQAAAYRD